MLLPISIFGRSNEKVLIGNFHYQAPNGISFIVEGKGAFVINPDLGINKHHAVLFDDNAEGFAQAHLHNDYNAGIVAPDDSYHKTVFELSNNNIVEFEWSKIGNAVVGRLSAGIADEMTFDLSKNWPGFQSTYNLDADGITGKANSNQDVVRWKMKADRQPVAFDGESVIFKIGDIGNPMRFVAGFGELPAMEQVDSIIPDFIIASP